MKNLIKKIIKEDFEWAKKAQINWSTYYNEILENVQGLPEKVEDVTEEILNPIWMKLDVLSRETKENTKLESVRLIDEIWFEFRHILEKLDDGTLTQKSYDTTKNILIPLIIQLRGRLMSINESEFDWAGNVDESPNYQGHPQGVVHLRSHDEIEEFFDLIGSTYGIIGKRKNELERTKRDFHSAFDETRDRFESDDWGGHSNWIPTISASFFISKKDPTKYDTGYWDFDVDESSVEDWLVNEGCEHEVIDCDNWKIYTDISQLRTLFNDYTGEVLHKTKSGKPLKVGDKVKVIDPDSDQYGEVLEVEHLVGGDGYEKHGGAFQTIEFDTLYFAGHEVEHIEDLNENFDWTESVPNPGKYDTGDLDFLVNSRGIEIGDKIHLKGHARDINRVFNHIGVVNNFTNQTHEYSQWVDGELIKHYEYEHGIVIRFDDDSVLRGANYGGGDLSMYELNDTFGDQHELTFDIVKDINESFDWAEDVPGEIPEDWNTELYYIYQDDEGYGFMKEYEFIGAPNHRFTCSNYDECPQSVGDEIYLSYPDRVRVWTGLTTREVWADKVVFEFGDELIDDFKSGEEVGGRYVWDENQKWFFKVD